VLIHDEPAGGVNTANLSGELRRRLPITKAQMAEIRSWPVCDLQFFIVSPTGRKCSAGYLNKLWNEWRASDAAKPSRDLRMTVHGLCSTANNDRRRAGGTDGLGEDGFPAICASPIRSNPAGRAAIGENRNRPNLQTRRPICKHAGTKTMIKRAFRKSYLTAH